MKIGATTQEPSTCVKRLIAYKGGIVCASIIIPYETVFDYEQKLIDQFKGKFKLAMGQEYFACTMLDALSEWTKCIVDIMGSIAEFNCDRIYEPRLEHINQEFTNQDKISMASYFHDINDRTNQNEFKIDLSMASKWLNGKKGNLKVTLISSYKHGVDYTISKLTSIGRGRKLEKIMLTADCFKFLCMRSQTTKAQLVRTYYVELENLLQYGADFPEKLQEHIRNLNTTS